MRVTISGGAMTPFNRRKDNSSYRDWVYDAFYGALLDSGVDKCNIDALVVASESDFFSAQLNPAPVLADGLGLHNIQTYRAEGGGATGHVAVQLGASLVASGHAKRVAVLGFDGCASHLPASDILYLYNQSYDGWFEGQQDISSTAIYALSALAYMHQRGANEQDFATVVVRNRRYAMHNKNAHLSLDITVEDVLNSPIISTPYHRLDCSPLSDGSACIILTDDTPKVPHVQITGMAIANDFVRLGDRPNPAQFQTKQHSAKKAYAMAGISPNHITAIEMYDSYSGAQLQGLEALGVTDDAVHMERRGGFDIDNGFAVNISGGLLGQGVPVGAVGVAQFLTLYKLLTGTYDGVCSYWDSPYAVVDTHGGIATNCAVSVLRRHG